MVGQTQFNVLDWILELALPTSSCSEFLASREFRILSFCCFSRLPIPFPSAIGRNCRNDVIQLVHKFSLQRQTQKPKPLRYKNISMFARMLWKFLARQLLIKLPTTCCCRSHASNILKILFSKFFRKISFSSRDRQGLCSKLYMTAIKRYRRAVRLLYWIISQSSLLIQRTKFIGERGAEVVTSEGLQPWQSANFFSFL